MRLNFKEAYHNFLKSNDVRNMDVEILDLEKILETIVRDYTEVEILKLDSENPENDMLLFEYGNYDWTDEGKKFNISVKRQLFFEKLDECGYYGVRIYFDKMLVGEIEGFSKWCENKNDIDNWLLEIKRTPGLQKVIGKPAIKVEFELEKPH